MSELKRGTQIVYVPSHADGDIKHPDCEEGFVISKTSDKYSEAYFCRYWSKSYRYRLRTTANSEATNRRDLIVKDTRHQGIIEEMFRIIEKGYPDYISEEQWDRYDKAMYEKGKANDRT